MLLTDLQSDECNHREWAEMLDEGAENVRQAACDRNGCSGYEDFAADADRMPAKCTDCVRRDIIRGDGYAELRRAAKDRRDKAYRAMVKAMRLRAVLVAREVRMGRANA